VFVYLLSQQFVTEGVQRANLACENTAGDEAAAGQFDADDRKQIRHHDGNGTKHGSQILRQLRTSSHAPVLQIDMHLPTYTSLSATFYVYNDNDSGSDGKTL